MMGRTHRAGGTAFAIVGFEVMRQQGMLLEDVQPLLQLAVMYPVAQWASTLPDLDHHWGSVGSKTPVNYFMHKLLHLTRPKHRSWQTHSVLVSGGFLFLLYSLILMGNNFWLLSSPADWVIARLLIMGFILGYASHLILDLINPKGIHLYPGFKIRLVPKMSFFATDGPWERKVIYPLCLGVALLFFISTLFGLAGIDLFAQVQAYIQTIF